MNLAWSVALALGMAQNDDEALKDLADRVRALEKRQEEKTLPEKKPAGAGQTWDAGKMLSFSSPDGNFTAKVGGRFYFVYRHLFDRQNQGGNQPDSFLVDTARIQLDGTFYRDFFYRVEGEGKSNTPGTPSQGAFRLNDVYLGWQGVGDWVAIQAGLFKVPLSQEETTSSRFIDFAERSLLNRITPGRDTGIMLKGSLADKALEWYLGFCNGHTDRENLKFMADTNDEKDLFGRVFITPLKNADLALFRQLRLGVDYERGKRDNQVTAPPANVNSGDLGMPAVLTFTSPAGVTVQGVQSRTHVNFSWLYGPMSLRAEYCKVINPLDGPSLHPRFAERACYVQGTVLLTGEEKTLENRIRPKSNFDPSEGGWGAWEIAARWAQIDAGNGRRAGVVTPANNERTTQLTLGINWWMTPNIRLMIDWEHLSYEEKQPVGRFGGLKKTEDEIYVRWQVDF